MERRQTMSPQELAACRKMFEKLDACGFRDFTYDNSTRRYVSLFTQGRWVNWQNAWREGQRYLKDGGSASVTEEPEPAEETAPRRIMRVTRTPPG